MIVFGIGTNFDWDCIRRIQQFGRISGFIAVTVFLVCIGGQDVANACDQQDQGQEKTGNPKALGDPQA